MPLFGGATDAAEEGSDDAEEELLSPQGHPPPPEGPVPCGATSGGASTAGAARAVPREATPRAVLGMSRLEQLLAKQAAWEEKHANPPSDAEQDAIGVAEKQLTQSRCPPHVRVKLREYFDRYDLDNSGLVEDEVEVQLFCTNVRFLCCNQYGLDVRENDAEILLAACREKLVAGSGLSFDTFMSLATPILSLYTLFGIHLETTSLQEVKPLTQAEIDQGFDQYRIREVGQHWERWVLEGDAFGSCMGIGERENEIPKALILLEEEYLTGMDRRTTEAKMQAKDHPVFTPPLFPPWYTREAHVHR